jgi:hypothetical protein
LPAIRKIAGDTENRWRYRKLLAILKVAGDRCCSLAINSLSLEMDVGDLLQLAIFIFR